MIYNFCFDTANNPGTAATITLLGSVTDRLSIVASIASGATGYFIMDDLTQSQAVQATFTAGTPNTLSVNTVFWNSATARVAPARLNFTGAVRIYSMLPAERAVYVNGVGTVDLGAAPLTTTGTVTSKSTYGFRNEQAAYGVFLYNDNGAAYLLQTANGSPSGTFNAYRPFTWSLSSGYVSIDATGAGVSFGGAVAVGGNFTVSSGVTNIQGYAQFTGYQGGASSGYVLASGGVNVYSGAYGANAYFNATILCGSVFATSDVRLKTDISPLTPLHGRDFVLSSRPKIYVKDGQQETGFLAQDQHKAGYSVSTAPHPGLPETVDEDGYVSPADTALVIHYEGRIAFLTAALQDVYARLEAIESALPGASARL